MKSQTKKGTFASAFISIAVWAGFCAGTLINLRYNIRTQGMGKVLDAILEPGADAESIASMENRLKNIPLYLILGITATVLVLSLAAWLVSRKNRGGIFSMKAIIGMTSAGMCMVMGYFIVESFMYGPIPATFSIPPNLLQYFGGVLAAGLLAPALRKANLIPLE